MNSTSRPEEPEEHFAERQADVRAQPDEALEDITVLAAQICEAPIALVSMADERHQWFKANDGFQFPSRPEENPFEACARQNHSIFIVPDAREDPRFAQHRWVTGPTGIRFYAGVPIVALNGVILGVIGVMDQKPRTLSPVQEHTLQMISRHAGALFELQRQKDELCKRATELQQSEDRLRSFMAYSPAAVWIVDASGMFRYANPMFCRLFGRGKTSLTGIRIGDLYEPAFAAEYMAGNRIVLEEKRVLQRIDPARRPDGSIASFLTVKFPLHEGNVPLVGGMAIDVTDRHEMENALQASESRFTAIFRASPSAIGITILATGEIVDLNERMSEFFGWSREEAIGKSVHELKLWVDPAQRARMIEQVMKTGSVRNEGVQLRLRNGEIRDVMISLERVDLPGEARPILVTMFTDVTERNLIEHQLRSNEAMLEQTARIAHVGGWEFDVQTGRGTWTEELARIHELDPDDEITVTKGLDYYVGESRTRIEDALRAAIETGTPYDLELEIKTAKGNRRWIRTICQAEMKDGMPTTIRGSLQDITERKLADNRFRRLFESNIQGVVYWNSNGAITGANDAFLRIIGYDRADLENGRINWVVITPLEYADTDEQALAEIAAYGICKPFKKEYIRKDGTRVPILLGAAMFEEDSEQGVGFVIDLTETKRMEDQFLRAQRMESVGTLAGGIAHDLNNALSPILMSLPLLKSRTQDEACQNLLTLIETSARRGADMVNQVLSYARGVSGQRLPILISSVLAEIQRIIESTFPKSIAVHVKIAADHWTVLGDPTQIHQLLLNICVNARDAMPQGGTLTIAASCVEIDAQYVALDPEAHEGPYVLVKVMDTGVGMREEILTHIFEPFFTTKEVGKGTGLGLSTSLSIAKSHGGFIRLASELGKGSEFSVYLPARLQATEIHSSNGPTELVHGNGELILVIDDENIMREVTQQTLESYGYRVLVAPGATEATAIFAERDTEIAAVLTDVAMPLMDGVATIHVLRRINPTIPVIVASGRYTEAHLEKLDALQIKHRLFKPFTAETLLRELKQALNP